MKDFESYDGYDTSEFWKDAFEALEIDFNHPKAHLLRHLAMMYGKNDGYESVYSYAIDLSEFLT